MERRKEEEKTMAGYKGKSMSNNAVAAYESGEKPISKWTKTAILESIKEIKPEAVDLAKELNAEELKEYFLARSSWHHTSLYYNRTNFYTIQAEQVERISPAIIADIKSLRKPTAKRSKEEIAAEKAEKARRKEEKAEKAEKEILFKYQTKYKSLSGFMRSTTVNIEELRRIRAEKIATKREELRNQWTRQGYKKGLADITNDAFIESYIR